MSLSEIPVDSITYPDSYKYFVFYTMGHGANQVFYTRDGSVPYNHVVNQFQKTEDCLKQFSQRYFFFDCCRCHRLTEDSLRGLVPLERLERECRLVFAAGRGETSWGEKGVSFMTKEIVRLLPNKSMDKVIRKLKENLHTINLIKQAPTSQTPTQLDTTVAKLNLSRIHRENIKPKITDQPQVDYTQRDGPHIHFSAQFHQPLAKNSTGSVFERLQVEIQDGADWGSVHDERVPEGFVFSSNFPLTVTPALNRSQANNICIRVVAHYSGGLRVCSDPTDRINIRALVQPSLNDAQREISLALLKWGQSTDVAWTLEHSEPCITGYQVNISRAQAHDGDKIYEHPVAAIPHQTVYHETLTVPKLLLLNYDAITIVLTTSYNDGTTASSQYDIEVNKRRFRQKLVYILGIFMVICFLVATALTTVVSLNIVRMIENHQYERYAIFENAVVMGQPIEQSIKTVLLTSRWWDVVDCDDHDSNVDVYCAGYDPTHLDSARQTRELGPHDSYHERNRCLPCGNYSLPLSTHSGANNATPIYALKGTNITFEICRAKKERTVYRFNLVLIDGWEEVYNFVSGSGDFKPSSIIANTTIRFNTSDTCQNYSIATIPHATYVYVVIETFSRLEFETLDSFISQVFYNATELQLVQPKNKLNTDDSFTNTISRTKNAKLLCTGRPPMNEDTYVKLCITPDITGQNVKLAFTGGVAMLCTLCFFIAMCPCLLFAHLQTRCHCSKYQHIND